MSDVTIIIPARYESTRFPGKPLALINGKPMILHVCDGCAPAFGKDKVIVTTDDDRIESVVTNAGYKVIMTRKDQVFLTGMDRVSYASQFVDSKYIINVQGDEPLVCGEDIKRVYEKIKKVNAPKYGRAIYDMECGCVNCFKVCKNESKPYRAQNGGMYVLQPIDNPNTIKMVLDKYSDLQYMSRQPIPTKAKIYKKQVCIYGLTKETLNDYYGIDEQKSEMELGEDVEILRMLETEDIHMIETKNEYQSVDCPEDIEKVERILNG